LGGQREKKKDRGGADLSKGPRTEAGSEEGKRIEKNPVAISVSNFPLTKKEVWGIEKTGAFYPGL